MKWYVVHTQTGMENKVKANLEVRAKADGMEEMLGQVLIPTEKVSEVRAGKKKVMDRKFYPGYIIVQMDLNDRSWHMVRNTPGISGFVGARSKPTPLRESDIEEILKTEEEQKTKPKPKTEFQIGESIRVKDGAFTNFNGTIEDVFPDKGKLKAMVVIFGRSTPVELEYWQVEKL